MDFSAFVMPVKTKKEFDEAALKFGSLGKFNVFFTTGYSNATYYYLSQLAYLSKLNAEHTKFFIALADMDVLPKTKNTDAREDFSKLINFNLRELKAILMTFGIAEENIFIFKLSDAWLKLIEQDNKKLTDFYNLLAKASLEILKMPPDYCDLHYRPLGYKFTFSLLLRKAIELFIANYLHKIYPEEINGKINLLLSGHGSSPVIFKLRDLAITNTIIPSALPVASLPGIPCFGRGEFKSGGFLMPNWDMDSQTSYSIIEKYKVPAKHIRLLFDLILNPFLDKFIIFDKNNKPIVSSAITKKQLTHLSLTQQRRVLAHNLHNFMQQIKGKAFVKENKDYLVISDENELEKLGKVLNSGLARKVLLNCNGTLTVSEIAKKLNKHVSNISNIVSNLKQNGFVKTTPEKKVMRTIRTVKIDLDKTRFG